MVISLSVILTLAAWYISKTQIESKIEQRFEFQTSQLLALVSERMAHYEDALQSGVAVISSHNYNLNNTIWKRFTDALKLDERYLGINGTGVIYKVDENDVETFIQQQQQTRPAFNIHPKDSEKEFWPVTYLQPVEGNKAALGLNMAFESNRYTAAKRARDTGSAQITGPIFLVQDQQKTPGFLQFLPFYSSTDINTVAKRQAHFIGLVYAPFIMDKLIEGTLKQENRHLIFSIYDGVSPLYDELTEANENFSQSPLFSKKVTLSVYGRWWDVNIQTANSFSNEVNLNQSTYILVGGLMIDAMLFLLFLSLSRTNRKSLSLAKRITKELRVSEKYFRHIIEVSPFGIIITDSKGVIEKLNPQAEQLFGYSAQELIGQSVDVLVPMTAQSNHHHQRQSYLKEDKQRRMGEDRKVSGLRKDGSEFPAEIGLANFNGTEGRKILSTIIDMTHYVQMTRELKRINKDLNEFVYVASHDLKAPLRGIMQLSSWISEDIEGIAKEETKEYLTLLQSRTVRLEKLLDDLLVYSRIGRKQGEIQTIDVNQLVEEVFDLLDPPVGFTLQVEGKLPTLDTLYSPLENVFRNLISNAIKHHDKPDGHIIISVSEGARFYEFTVQNDGPVIKEEHFEQIFEVFKTLKPRDQVEGSGMGLSIIKKVLDNQEASIKVISGSERGVSFIFTWPKNIVK